MSEISRRRVLKDLEQRARNLKTVDPVTTWNDADEPGQRVARYRDVRCPECGRMFFCLRWDDYGYPAVHCPPCGVYLHWPFDEIDGLKERYETGRWPNGGDS